MESKLFIYNYLLPIFLMVSSGLPEECFVLVAFSEFQNLHLEVNFSLLVSLEWLCVRVYIHIEVLFFLDLFLKIVCKVYVANVDSLLDEISFRFEN